MWKPSKSQKREFAQKMANDSAFKEAYEQRKLDRAEKRRKSSAFDYYSAGGHYIPTKLQHDAAFELSLSNPTEDQANAARMVMFGYSCNEKIHHDFIHIINEFIRK